jgi:hypothetical protein
VIRHDREKLTEPRVIICEGRVDEAFLRALISKRNLPNFCIRNPEDFGARGIDSIGEAISGLKIMPGFENLAGILVVVDSDDDPQKNFEAVRKQISSLGEPFLAPNALLERSSGIPSIQILTLPWINQPGCLETMLYPHLASRHSALASCVDSFLLCSGVSVWANSRKVAKVATQTLLGAVAEKSAATTLGRSFVNGTSYFDLLDPVFNDLAECIASYA